MIKLVSVRQALESKEWLGLLLGGPSFAVMRTLLIAAMGEPLTAPELATFTELTGRTQAPGEAVEELWLIAGRRSGKTRAIGTLAAYLAACVDYRPVLGPGERGVLPVLAGSVQRKRR
jgi:predicted metal-binding membrane protein